MHNENFDNLFSWKNKLDNLESLPGETFNTSASWEKLHNRLQKKKSSKKDAFVWLAAACVLFAIFLSGILLSKKEVHVAKKNATQKQSSEINDAIETASVKTEKVERKAIFQNAKKHAKSFIVTTKQTSLAPGKMLADEAVVSKENFIQPKISTEEFLNIPADTTHPLVVKIAAKSKLRVVHINELGQAAEEVKYAGNERAPFPIKINGKDIFSGALTRNNSDHGILKINLSRQN